MLTLRQMRQLYSGLHPEEYWEDLICCGHILGCDIETGNLERFSLFSFLLICRGSVSIKYSDRQFTLNAGDLHVYAPGIPTEIVHMSDDYEAWILNIDEQMVYHTPQLEHVVKVACFTVSQHPCPVLNLSGEIAERIRQLMVLVHEHILAKPTAYTKELLLTAIRLMCVELLNTQDKVVVKHHYSERHEKTFADFLQLVSQHFVKHHDLAFYAGHLNMTTTYLSRIVKQMSGHTVQHFISQALASEATVLLKTTSMSITEIALRLNFADQASFTKFFIRMKEMSPKAFRKS